MEPGEAIVALTAILGVLVGLPWIILHYISKWKMAKTLSAEDEDLLDELHDLARRLDDRMGTIERIVQAENPNWRQLAFDPASLALEESRGPALATRTRQTESAGRGPLTRRRNS